MPKTLFATVSLVLAAATSAQTVPFSATYTGFVNNEAVDGSGGGAIDPTGRTSSAGRVVFQSISTTFNPLAINALLCNLCPIGFQANGPTQDLFSLTGGSYSMTRVFTWVGVPNSSITTQATVTFDDGGDGGQQSLSSTMSILGTYLGPTDLTSILSYTVTWLPSSAPGEFFEAGTAVIATESGTPLVVQFASVFTGLSTNLTAPQFGTGDFDATYDEETGTLDLSWEGEFIPSPAAAGVFVMAGVAAARRRR